MRSNLSAHYRLTQNIDANASWSEGLTGCAAYDGSTVPASNACTGWVPVGTDGNRFLGSLNGQGYVVSDLYVNSASNDANSGGLFAYTSNKAHIQNLGLTDVNIRVTSFDEAYAGGIVGENYGRINNVYITGSVYSSSI